MKLLIIVPAFNESKVISQTLKDIKIATKTLRNTKILVVDDGSTDTTQIQAQKSGAVVVRHILNRGLGGAIGTGLEYARKTDYDIAVTIDADGQHNPLDIKKVIKPIVQDNADIVIGTRTHKRNQTMPALRKIILWISNEITLLLFGQHTTDSQSGFRAFGAKAISNVRIKTERMEVSSELFAEIKRLNLRLSEVPITVIYTKYSKNKGQSNTDAFNVGFKLLLRLFR